MSARILILQSRMSIDFLAHYVIKKNQFRTPVRGHITLPWKTTHSGISLYQLLHRPLPLLRGQGSSMIEPEVLSSSFGWVHLWLCQFLWFQSSLSDAVLSPTSAMCTAATWFHRFYMRYSMNDFHRQVPQSPSLEILYHSSPIFKRMLLPLAFF